MSLDFDLITQSVNYSKNQLSNKEITECPHLFLLSDFINPKLLEKLLAFVGNDTEHWQTVLYQETSVRRSITWVPETVIEETHIVMQKLTDDLNTIFQKQTTFLGISIWKDVHPYSIGMHVDNDMVGTAMQLYLTSGPSNLNTIFKYDSKIISANYQKNSGYMMNNTHKVVHGMLNPVPENHIRYSLYAVWTDK
jgi:hypothetical protein